jgi:HIRAN domain
LSSGIRRLDVLWRVPGHRRFRVGTLARDDDGNFCFEYAAPRELDEAVAAGFRRIPGLEPGESGVVRSAHLFATFAQRIPSPKRPDFDRLIEQWSVRDPGDAFEILARSGGLLLTDHLELSEHRDDDDDLSIPLSFVVAGMRYGDDSEATRARPGDPVLLTREAANASDPWAVQVSWSGARLGYVPRQYARLVASLLEAGARLDAVIERRLLVPNEGPRWVVRASNPALHRVA